MSNHGCVRRSQNTKGSSIRDVVARRSAVTPSIGERGLFAYSCQQKGLVGDRQKAAGQPWRRSRHDTATHLDIMIRSCASFPQNYRRGHFASVISMQAPYNNLDTILFSTAIDVGASRRHSIDRPALIGVLLDGGIRFQMMGMTVLL